MRLLAQLSFLAALLGAALPATADHARASTVPALPSIAVYGTEPALQPLADPAAVFRLSYPATFLASPLPGDDDFSYGFSLSAPDGSAQIRLVVTPAQRAWALSKDELLPAGIDLTPLSDEQWRDILHDLAAAAGSDQDQVTAIRPLSANFRSALVETANEGGAPVIAWIEEIDGVLATLVLAGADGQADWGLRNAVLPTYTWSPAHAIATLAGKQQATAQSVTSTFRDPAGAFTLALPHFLTFTKMETTRAGRAYTFEDDSRDSRFTIRFTSVDEPPTDETWPDLAADMLAGTLAQLRSTGEAAQNTGRTSQPPKIGVEQEGVAGSRGYYRAAYALSSASHYVLWEAWGSEGILVTAVSVTPVAEWKTQETATRALLQSIVLDGDAIRAELEAQHNLPANLETLKLGGEIEFLPADEREQLRRQRRAPLQLNATFAEMDLLRPFTLVVRKDNDVIGRVNAEWSMLADFSRDFGIVRSIEEGMHVRLRYWPPRPLTPGDDYAADLYYNDRLLATHAFRVEEVKPPAQPVVVRFWVAPDPQHDNHSPKRRLYAPNDMLTVFLDADYPAGALARIVWSGPEGLIPDSVHSTYVAHAAHHQVDAHRYRPAAGWTPGDYLVTAQINGDRWAEKDFTIVEPAAAPIESDVVAALQLPATVSKTIVLEQLAGGKLRLQVAGPPPADPSYLLTDETITLWDARLRHQGWLRAPAGATTLGKGATYAWTKDGDTLVATTGPVSVDATQQQFTLAVTYLEAGAVSAPPRAALVPITQDNLDRLAPVIGAGQPAWGPFSQVVLLGSGTDVQAVALQVGKHASGTSLQGFATWPPVRLYQETSVTTRFTHLAAGGAYVAAAGLDEQPSAQATPVIWLWHADPWRFAGILSGHGMPITAMAITTDGTTLASAADDGTLRLWPVAGGPPRLWKRANPLPVTALAFSLDGSLLAAGHRDGSIEIRTVTDGAILANSALAGAGPDRLAFIPGPEPRLAVIVENTVQLWTVEDNGLRPLAMLPAEGGAYTAGRIADVVVSTDGAWLATVGEQVQFLDTATGGLLHTLAPQAGHDAYFVQAALSPDGLYLALLDNNGLLQLWAIPAA